MDSQEIAFKEQELRLEKNKLIVSILTSFTLGVLTVMLTYYFNSSMQERGAAISREGQILSQKQTIYSEFGKDINIFYIYVEQLFCLGAEFFGFRHLREIWCPCYCVTT